MVDRGLFKLQEHHLISALFILGDKSSNDVLDLVVAVQNILFIIPLVDDEPKLLGYLDPRHVITLLSENLTHDSDEHVEKMDKHDECREEEKDDQDCV